MASLNQRFLDFQVAQQVRWIRVQNRDVREALKILRRADEELADALRRADLDEAVYPPERTEALRRQIARLIATVHDSLAHAVRRDVREAAAASADVEAEAFRRLLPAGLDPTTPNLGVIQTVAVLRAYGGAPLADWLARLREADVRRAWGAIVDGITTGTTTEDIIRGVIGRRTLRYRDGVREVTRRGAEALVRTAITHATSVGRQMVWEDNQRLISSVRWVATLDTRTSPVCRARDGRVGPVTADADWSPPRGAARLSPPMARPPAHPNCRSTTVAVTRSWRDLGIDRDDLDPETRASMDGRVPAEDTYFSWLSRQSAATQSEVLGPTRYALWQDGGVRPERFQNDAGVYYTLAELRRRQPKAFEEAGL